MSRNARFLLVVLLGFLLFPLPACYEPGGPVPEAPLDPPPREPIPQQVVVEPVFVPSPYPRENGEVPADWVTDWDCDQIRFLRYRPDTGCEPPKPVDAVLVLIPGFMGGANSFDYLGRQLVSAAEADSTVGSLEVWAIDRRTNCLEDLTGLNAAEAAEDTSLAVDYYYRGAEIGGRTFQGFRTDQDLPFLSEFGLALLMNDLWAILEEKIPDPEIRAKTVFVGGHSAGGAYASYFAGWDFDGDPATTADAGFANCAGLIGLDGRVGARPTDFVTKSEYQQGLQAIRLGTSPRLSLFLGVTPEALALFEIVGMNAHFQPNAEATLARSIPYSESVAGLIRMLHSRDLGHFLTGVPAFENFRYTNEAVLGIFFDDNFNPVSILQASMGFLQGGPVVSKVFPADLADLIGLPGFDSQGMFIPWDAGPLDALGTGPLYSWVNYDRVGNAADPQYRDTTGTVTYTDWRNEVTDIQDVAVSLYRGPSNFPEWYYTSRINLDRQAAAAPYNTTYGLNFFHNDRIETVPILNINASDREGYNHQDVLFAAVDRPGHRESEVLGPLMDFVFSQSTGTVQVP